MAANAMVHLGVGVSAVSGRTSQQTHLRPASGDATTARAAVRAQNPRGRCPREDFDSLRGFFEGKTII